MHYIEGIKTIPNDAADNALYLGSAIHTGIEKGVEAGIQEYYNSFPIIDNLHINEAMKLEYLIPKVQELLPKGIHELKIDNPHYIGYMDLLVEVKEMNGGFYDLYDFKYSNNIQNYMDSEQLHLYKYFFQKQNPGKEIRKLYFVFIPKVKIKQKKTEDLYEFRKQIMVELKKSEVKIKEVKYDVNKVIDFTLGIKSVLETTEYDKNKTYLCNWCEYQNYCEKGETYMLLPSNERRNINETKKRKIWIYGPSFSGKTTMLDGAPDPLNLNTDGNIKFVTMQYIAIKDEIKVEGRMTKRTFAWQIFKDTIDELEKKQNTFKTIIVDLLEDTREMCRIFKYDEMGIQHESDSGYGKGWDIIKTEYLATIRRLFNLDYENIVVLSHEDVSKDITKKNGQNITRISPNIQDAIANKVAGMVDLVARVVVEDDGSRTLNFKSNEVIFGGGRLKGIKVTSIPLTWDALMGVYEEANASTESIPKTDTSTRTSKKSVDKAEPNAEKVDETKTVDFSAQEVQKTEPTTRTRRKKTEDASDINDQFLPTDKPVIDLEPVNIGNEIANEVASSETEPIPDAAPVLERKTRKKRGE